MNRRHRELMERIRAAKPDTSGHTEGWERSGRAGRLLDEIVARTEEETEDERLPSGPRTRAPRWVLNAAAAVVVVGFAAFVAFYLVPTLSDGQQTVSQPVETTVAGGVDGPGLTTPSSAAPVFVTKEEALEGLLEFAAKHPSLSPGKPWSPSRSDGSLLDSASEFGLVAAQEFMPDDLEAAATRREYAMWVVRGWELPPQTTSRVPRIADSGDLSLEELSAAERVVSLGIMELDEASAFNGDNPLTPREIETALAALNSILER